MILNLAVNGREAMPEGGRLLLKTRRCARVAEPGAGTGLQDQDCVALTIEDAGTGIEAEHLDQIFEPFYTTKRHGTGLGLATVYGIVQQSGGQIRVESTPGQGTAFEILLPIHVPAPGTDQPVGRAPGFADGQ